MIKVSMLVMIALTILVSTLLRWREEAQSAKSGRPAPRRGLVGGLKHKANRWVSAAAIAAIATITIVGGLNWLRVWQGG